MKHIGIVGCSHEGAALCYRTICALGAQQLGGHAHPEVSLHSPSFGDYFECLEAGDWEGVADLMVTSAEKLAGAGADFLICPDNTIHQVLPEVARRTELPWLNIAEVVRDEAVKRGFWQIGLMGTRWLVDGPVYPDAFASAGLEYLRPEAVDRATVNRIILDELVRGQFHLKSVRRADRGDGALRGCKLRCGLARVHRTAARARRFELCRSSARLDEAPRAGGRASRHRRSGWRFELAAAAQLADAHFEREVPQAFGVRRIQRVGRIAFRSKTRGPLVDGLRFVTVLEIAAADTFEQGRSGEQH